MLKADRTIMTTLLNYLRSVLPSIESQQERDELYLSGAVDIYDLERRMREIDDRGRRPSAIALGLYTR
ncbi:MAG: DUF3563 family protein [Caldimonas sp.]